MPSSSPITKKTILDRVRISKSGCWLWTLSLTPNGYARMTRNKKTILIHRKAFELWCGIPLGQVNHRCHCPNKHCVNPDHLYDGNQSENMKDVSSLPGYKNSQLKFSKKAIRTGLVTVPKN